ncbi:MAG: GNAT family N-acetyltransferase, partial [Paracoccaceae bacterium]
MTIAPTLTSDRLFLTQMTLDHIHALYPLMGSARTGYMDGPFTKRAAWYLLAADVASWTLLGFGGWAITDRNTGQLLGQIALSQPPHYPERELGWLLFEHAEGQGYAYEAAKTVLAWARDTQNYITLVSYITPENSRSVALAKRLGAVLDLNAV